MTCCVMLAFVTGVTTWYVDELLLLCPPLAVGGEYGGLRGIVVPFVERMTMASLFSEDAVELEEWSEPEGDGGKAWTVGVGE